ncbi:MAG: hypothetical protein WCO24_05685, partial [Actinomycetes bacterium]
DQDSVALVDARAEYSNGMVRVTFDKSPAKFLPLIFDAIRAAIPESNIIPNLLNQGKTAVGENQRHAVSRAFISVAKFLQGEDEHPQEHRGLFSRRAK